ncbi:LytR C-terminal domain-containing protein [Kineococcus sp. SYSU DK003]|uniref:LytR C-terminal domain-containing protein n=1 Tax=Kineococcus sp. SYSU DK003 TaxID=3383124 RepID=UPI003D7C3822
MAGHDEDDLRDGRLREERPHDGVLPEVDEIDDGLDEESFRRLSGRRHSRLVRQRIVFAVVVVLVLAVGGGAYLVWSDRWQPGGAATPTAAAPAPTCTPQAVELLPPAEVSLTVLNGTDRRGLAASVAGELRSRGFVVTEVGNAPAATGPVTAVVTFPAGQRQQATTLGARFPEVQLVEDPAAAAVSVSLGDGYQQLVGEEAVVAPVTEPVC